MTEDLVFAKDASEEKWVCEIAATGDRMVVQVDRDAPGLLLVWANVEGMRRVPVMRVEEDEMYDVIFEVDMPAGVTVTVESYGEPAAAKVMTEG